MKPLRVLHVVFNMDRGGLESRLMDIYRCIDLDKVQFDFLENTNRPCYFDSEIAKMGGKIYKNNYSRKNILESLLYVKQLLDNGIKYDIIHIHESHLPNINFFIALYSKHIGVKTRIIHSRNSNGPRVILHNMCKKWYENLFTHHFACSEKAARWMFTKELISSKQYKVINNAINTSQFAFDKQIRDEVRNELHISSNYVIGHVGRFFEQKNHIFLIDFFNLAHLKNPNLKLVLVGDGPLLQNVKNHVYLLGLENAVVFTGVRSDIPRILNSFDCFVLPSLYEGLPGVGVEAQASGLPCIFSDFITEEVCIIPQNLPFLSINESNSIQLWADKLLSLSNTEFDRSLAYKSVADAGFDSNGISRDLLKFYTSL